MELCNFVTNWLFRCLNRPGPGRSVSDGPAHCFGSLADSTSYFHDYRSALLFWNFSWIASLVSFGIINHYIPAVFDLCLVEGRSSVSSSLSDPAACTLMLS